MTESDEEKKGTVKFTTTAAAWRYLGWLSRHTLLGESESEVAKNILLQRLSEMRREEYKEPEKT